MTKESDGKAPGAYLYAVISGVKDAAFDCAGIDDAGVRAVSDGHIAALISDTWLDRVRPKRRLVAAHQAVLQHAMERTAILPVSFGVIADSADAVRAMLARHRDELTGELAQVEDQVEMSLRVTLDVPNVFEHLVHRHPDLAEQRDRLWGGDGQPTREQMIGLGRTFERLLVDGRENAFELVTRILLKHGVTAIERKEPVTEHEVLNLACLVPRAEQAAFEHGVSEAANRFDKNHSFDYSGPWPAYSFIKLEIQLDQLDEAA